MAIISKTTKLVSIRQKVVELDVTSPESIIRARDHLIKSTAGTSGQLNMLISNAGYGGGFPLLTGNLDDSRAMFETNIWGSLSVVQVFAPVMIKTIEDEGGPSINPIFR